MVLHWVEILKFIKKNFISMLVGTVIVSIGLMIVFNENEAEVEFSNVEQEANGEVIEKDQTYFSEVPPTNFHFYIEFEDGRSYTNHLLIEQYLLSEQNLEKISEEIEIDVTEIIKKTENKIAVDYNTNKESKVIGISRNENTHLMELSVNMGSNRENLKIAKSIFETISNKEIPFLADKQVFIIKEPSLKEIDSIDNTVLSEVEPEILEKNTVKFVLIRIILGGIVTLTLLLGKTFYNNKLMYSFSYHVKENDRFILIDKNQDNNDSLIEILTLPQEANIVVVSEDENINLASYSVPSTDNLERKLVAPIKSNLLLKESQNIDRLVYIIIEGETSRKWYNEQRYLDSFWNIPKFIVQINKE